ncbi:bifunctional diguanylate cyclase/phosphodiesterase [Microvirga sp. KLBC 81]|uniref:putative bifunctional diguanylate cyclase/phosphodiesterase n=1 Tax=Microvirga sp. KLBC 81 TaxID=1862707 RepID=UPI000D51B51E|nr:EAL domain-containing protein [Microvirga sp. KLBC 81]PVE22853.1 bifunctional diguanylate cyclase/phosphodiesterase [Microvirga sp. KLBC 81]
MRVLLPVAASTAAALALAALALLWAVRQSDEISTERQQRTTERSIRAIVGELAKQQEMVAVWNETVLELRKVPLDEKWLDANIGRWLHVTFGQDRTYILNARNEPVDVTIDGARAATEEFEKVRPSFEWLIQGLRGDAQSSHYGHSERPVDENYLTSGRAVHDAHLLELQGRPAAVSAMKIVPENDDIAQEPGSEFLLVSVRFLDGSFLRQLSQQNLIEGLRFSQVNEAGGGEVGVPLRSDEGNLIGYFIWRPELPGTTILRVISPSIAVVCVLIIGVMTLLARSLRRSMAKLRKAIAELRASEAQAHHLAFHDVLTGLPNRALFDDNLDRTLAGAGPEEPLAVLMLDLDRFKHVNDTLGHHAGDCVVREFGQRLFGLLRGSDIIARLGGDEFAIVLTGITGRDDVETICARILDAVRQPFDVAGRQAFVGVSIGVALAPDAGSERIDLMRKADIALYQAKAEGRDAYRIFTAVMDETVKVRSMIEEELRAALVTGNDLRLFYQPQVDVGGQSITGLEALVRWNHPTRGMIAPNQFIPIAEETGLISPLGEWVLRQACLASKRWPDLTIAVNLSPVQFRSGDLAQRLIGIVSETGADPRRVEFEITESLLLDDSDLSRSVLKMLRQEGFKIALDDFGTGYSSLSYLRRFEVDKIKIDRSFVRHLGEQNESVAIVTAIVSLCRAMGLTVTAEGVETEDQKTFLSQTGCNEMQGFLFSRALPEEQITDLLGGLGNMLSVQGTAMPALSVSHSDQGTSRARKALA